VKIMVATTEAASSRGSLALWAFAGMTLIWGSTWYAIHVQLNGTPPFVSVCLRFALAALAVAAWMLFAGHSLRIERRLWPLVLVQGATVCGINYLFAYTASAHIASGLVALLFAFNVVISLLLEPLLLGRRSPPVVWVAAALGVIGLGLVLLPDVQAIDASRTLWGAALALGGALSVGLGNVLSSRLMSGGAGLFAINFYGFCIGAVIAAIAATASGEGWNVVWSPAYLGSLAYLSLVGSVLAFALYLRAVRDLGPVRAGYSSVLTPIIALLISAALEGLAITLPLLLGFGLILTGNVLILRRRAKAA
jgi:drug/metabolite transporter (DMT)-like permease